MGIEYNATFAEVPERAALDALLRARHSFSRFDPAFASYHFRLATNPSAMPNVEVRIVLDSNDRVEHLYVCDYGDDGSILGDLVRSLRLTLEELE